MDTSSIKKVFGAALIVLIAFIFHSCSLLKFNFESQTPLEPELLKTRVMTHDFSKIFFHDIMMASDSIMNNEPEKQQQINALVWKINSSNAAKATIFQNNPDIALLDTWILTASMADFLKNGEGSELFGNSQPIAVETSDKLLSRIDTIATLAFSKNYDQAKHFVDSICENEPFHSLDFYKETVYNDWYRYLGIPDSLVEVAVGTLPEVLSDFSSRMTIGSDQTLRQAQWNGELLLKQSNLDSLDLQQISNDFDKRFGELITVIRNSGRNMQGDAVILRKDIRAFTRKFDAKMDSVIAVARIELALLRDSFSVEREAIMADLDRTSNKVVKTALEELRHIIKDILFYVLLILIAILFIPFAMGYVTGRTIGRRKKNEKKNNGS